MSTEGLAQPAWSPWKYIIICGPPCSVQNIELTLSLVNPTNSAILRTMPGSIEIVTLNTPEEKRTAPSNSRLCMGSVLLQSLWTMAFDSSLQNYVLISWSDFEKLILNNWWNQVDKTFSLNFVVIILESNYSGLHRFARQDYYKLLWT